MTDREHSEMLLEWSGDGCWWEGVSQPRSRKLSVASWAALHGRIHSSWRNHISSHGAAKLGSQPDLNKHHLFFIPQKTERLKERAALVCVVGVCYSKRERVCVGVWGREAEEGNRSRITSEGLSASVKLLSLGNRYIDLLTLSEPSASVWASCLFPQCRTLHPLWAKSHLSPEPWQFTNYSTERRSCPVSLRCILLTAAGCAFHFYCIFIV